MADHEPDEPSAILSTPRGANEEDALMQALDTAHPADSLTNESQFGDFAGTCIHAVNGVELVADADGVA